jgi:dihydropyrimidinase
MASYDLVVRHGTVATAADVFTCDIGVTNGRIVALGEMLAAGREEIDAAGRLVLPGGIDSHCHLEQPEYLGAVCADDFRSGTISAACGGNTTVIPFAMAVRGQSLRDVVNDYRQCAAGKAIIDYAIHIIAPDANATSLQEELPALIRHGYTSIKIFLTYEGFKLDDIEVLRILDVARREGALVMVHAENGDCIQWLTERLVAAGKTAPEYHGASRPMAVEREATHRAIALAEVAEVPILIVHVSGREAMEQIAWARSRGLKVFAETCPQYLFLSEEDAAQPDYEGAKHVCSPPPRDKANQEHLWRGLQNGIFQVVSSDHSPHRVADVGGKMPDGAATPFTRIANGVPGLAARLPLMFSEGVNKGRLRLPEFVALASTNAARLYGIYPRKGTIAVGADADLAIWNPDREVVIRHELLHDNVDYTPYEGMVVKGWPEITISRGDVVWRDGRLLGTPGRGAFIPGRIRQLWT